MLPRKKKKQLDSDIKKGVITGVTALVVTSGEKIITRLLDFLAPKAAPNAPILEPLKAIPVEPTTPWYRYVVLALTIILIVMSIISFYKYFKSKKH